MIIAAILAGGRGERAGGSVPKQLLMLKDRPVIQWSVDTFHRHGQIDKIIIVSEKESISTICGIFPESRYPKISAIIEGGKERVDSSAKAVFSGDYNPDDIFMIHDAARPFISSRIIDELIDKAIRHDASAVYVPVKDTIAVVENDIIVSTPERNKMFCAQTPQVFRYCLIKNAHKNFARHATDGITDDVSLVKATGHDVYIVTGSDLNFKITTELDYKIAGLLAAGGLV